MQDIWNEIAQWTAAGRPFALARVVRTWGSAPRGVGAAMIVGADWSVAGSVSGGCIEGAVIEEAKQVLENGRPRQVSYGVDNEKAWSVGLSCGGEVTVLIEKHLAFGEEAVTRAVWEALDAAVRSNRPAILLTRLQPTSGSHLLVYPDGRTEGDWGSGTAPAVAAALDAFEHRRPGVVELGGESIFVHLFPHLDQLLIVGANHIALPLVQFAHPLEFETSVIDPRRVFAAAERFPVPPHHLIDRWPEQVLPGWELDGDTYAVLLTHDPKIDDPALHLLLRSEVRYIGALGSRRTHAKRCARLQEAGFDEDEIARIRGPVGLDIGAQTPTEIALSIMAEVVATRRNR